MKSPKPTTVSASPFWEMRSSWDIAGGTDIFIKRELIDGYQITERVAGYCKLRVFWGINRTIDGWMPEVYFG